MIRLDAYFDILTHLLCESGIRVLIFDERGVGKEAFYREWLGESEIEKMLFFTPSSLRESLCVLSSSQVRLIFGPCTGILHCASGIYNIFVAKGYPVNRLPLMITYTGKYEKEGHTAEAWWGTSPLIHCLVLRRRNSISDMVLLKDMKEDEKADAGVLLPCDQYSSEMIIDFLNQHLYK